MGAKSGSARHYAREGGGGLGLPFNGPSLTKNQPLTKVSAAAVAGRGGGREGGG